MKRAILLICILSTSSPTLFAQKLEDVGAGLINFLLRNPKSADRMKPEEKIALDIIADLLRTEGQRQHELEYAATGRNQITINTNDGRQAQFVRDQAGKVFLLLDGVIHPISTELVNQSLAVESTPHPEPATNNLKTLEEKYNKRSNDIEIKTLFAYKWRRDFNQNGLPEFNEYRQIKRQFYANESFKLAIAFQTDNGSYLDLVLEIIDDYSGTVKHSERRKIQPGSGSNVFDYDIPNGLSPAGTFILHAKLIGRGSGKLYAAYSDSIQITTK
jgi:hypothetical protein